MLITSNVAAMAVPFKLNSAYFRPLLFPFSKSYSSVSVSPPFATASTSLSDNACLSSKHLSNLTNELVSMVSVVLCRSCS